jgi:hypothetical protein
MRKTPIEKKGFIKTELFCGDVVVVEGEEVGWRGVFVF